MEKPELFGKIGVRLGFIRSNDVDKALKIQEDLKKKYKPHKLIGIILLEMGALGTTELIAVLKEIEEQRRLIQQAQPPSL